MKRVHFPHCCTDILKQSFKNNKPELYVSPVEPEQDAHFSFNVHLRAFSISGKSLTICNRRLFLDDLLLLFQQKSQTFGSSSISNGMICSFFFAIYVNKLNILVFWTIGWTIRSQSHDFPK